MKEVIVKKINKILWFVRFGGKVVFSESIDKLGFRMK